MLVAILASKSWMMGMETVSRFLSASHCTHTRARKGRAAHGHSAQGAKQRINWSGDAAEPRGSISEWPHAKPQPELRAAPQQRAEAGKHA